MTLVKTIHKDGSATITLTISVAERYTLTAGEWSKLLATATTIEETE